MKYVIVEASEEDGGAGVLIPFIFPDALDHSKVSDRFRHLLMFEGYNYTKVSSAGFINMSGKCYGKSVTLGISSSPDDSKLINDISNGYVS